MYTVVITVAWHGGHSLAIAKRNKNLFSTTSFPFPLGIGGQVQGNKGTAKAQAATVSEPSVASPLTPCAP